MFFFEFVFINITMSLIKLIEDYDININSTKEQLIESYFKLINYFKSKPSEGIDEFYELSTLDDLGKNRPRRDPCKYVCDYNKAVKPLLLKFDESFVINYLCCVYYEKFTDLSKIKEFKCNYYYNKIMRILQNIHNIVYNKDFIKEKITEEYSKIELGYILSLINEFIRYRNDNVKDFVIELACNYIESNKSHVSLNLWIGVRDILSDYSYLIKCDTKLFRIIKYKSHDKIMTILNKEVIDNIYNVYLNYITKCDEIVYDN